MSRALNNGHHVVYIDESGNGQPIVGSIKTYWVSVAVMISMDELPKVDAGIENLLKQRFRPYAKEIKGCKLPRYLRPGNTMDDVAQDVANLCSQVHAHCWGTATRHGKPAPSTFPKNNPLPKDIARQFLFERINGFLTQGYLGSDDCIIVWDLTERQELSDFSSSIATFRNAFNQSKLCPRLAPAVLGGLSHDWKGLQIADIMANFALHHLGCTAKLPDAKQEKSDAFIKHFHPRLQSDQYNRVKGIGWKVW